MGNCIRGQCCLSSVDKGRVRKISSCLSYRYMSARRWLPFLVDSSRQPEELCDLLPSISEHHGHLVSSQSEGQEGHRGQRVKIMLTRHQLEMLMTMAKKCRSKGMNVRFCSRFCRAKQRWQPSLASIPESRMF